MYKRIIAVFLILSIVIMGVYPREIFLAAARAVNVWFNIFFPAVFPSMVIIRLLSVIGASDKISSIFGGFMRIFNLPESSFEAFSGGFLSGFPSGGKIIEEMLQEGRIGKKEARKLFLVSNNPGIFFITSTVGAGILKNPSYGYLLLLSAILSSVTAGMTVSGDFSDVKHVKIRNTQKLDFFVLKGILMDSMEAVTRVGGFIILFSVISEGIGLIAPFNHVGMAVFSGIMEMTGGINRISALSIPIHIKLSVISAVISFGGLSVIGQCMSMIPENIVSVRDFMAIRILNGAIAFGITFFICIFLKL